MPKGYNNDYPHEVVEYVKTNYKNTIKRQLAQEIKEKFNVDADYYYIVNLMKKYNLKSGINSKFQKGHMTFNKGLKQTEYMSPEAIERTKATRFKKGMVTNLNYPVGTETTDSDGYTLVKVQNTGKRYERWRPKHRLIYEKEKGEIPNDHCVIFADGNITNFDINNLVVVSKSELVYLNKYRLIHKDLPELTKSGVLVARLKDKLYKKAKR